MIICCNIWMICSELNWVFYDPSWMLQISEFVWALRSSVWVDLKIFLLIDATDRSKISSDQKRLFFAVCLYPLSFFASTPFKLNVTFWFPVCNLVEKLVLTPSSDTTIAVFNSAVSVISSSILHAQRAMSDLQQEKHSRHLTVHTVERALCKMSPLTNGKTR